MSLYRTYRPQTFAEVAGQEHIKQAIQNEIANDSLVHAYIFSGPRAVGKTTTARILTRAINCLNRKAGESEPCNVCVACVAIHDNKTLDVIEIDAASHTGVDNVRDNIISAARVGRAGLSWKVFIIDEVHMLSTSAFNALLKILEEPPSNVLFILATTELHKVPATVV
ncbi:MAG: DNA polymerase III subunit gamma/tau, partial [Sedimentisphaerales bacterium]|nr:DNA polymerase III subunit gamma/tau [Sedimentisphaerales bacterium]